MCLNQEAINLCEMLKRKRPFHRWPKKWKYRNNLSQRTDSSNQARCAQPVKTKSFKKGLANVYNAFLTISNALELCLKGSAKLRRAHCQEKQQAHQPWPELQKNKNGKTKKTTKKWQTMAKEWQTYVSNSLKLQGPDKRPESSSSTLLAWYLSFLNLRNGLKLG